MREVYMRKVELNITFACNLKCPGCNRLCNLTQLDQPMTVEQVQLMIDNLRREKRSLIRTKVVGGEPTLHPQFAEICEVLAAGSRDGLAGKVTINTNGTTLEQWRGKLPPEIRLKPSPPRRKRHIPFLHSPRDLGLVSCGPCAMPRRCGFSLDSRGWLPCSAGIAISRLFGCEDLYRPLDGPLPTHTWGMDRLCGDCMFGVKDFCGRNFNNWFDDGEEPSPRWAEALKRYFARAQ